MKSTQFLVLACLLADIIQVSSGYYFGLGKDDNTCYNYDNLNTYRISTSPSDKFVMGLINNGDKKYEAHSLDSSFTLLAKSNDKFHEGKSFDILTGNDATLAVVYDDSSFNVVLLKESSGDVFAETKLTLKSSSKSVTNIVRLAEYNGTVYFVDNKGDVYNCTWGDILNQTSGSINVGQVVSLGGTVSGVTEGVRYAFVSDKKNGIYKTVDVKCLSRSIDKNGCVKEFEDIQEAVDFSNLTFIVDNMVFAQVKTAEFQYQIYDLSSSTKVSDDFVMLNSGCCTVDPLRAFIYCVDKDKDDDKYSIIRYPLNDFDNSQVLKPFPCQDNFNSWDWNVPSDYNIKVEYNLANEKGVICGFKGNNIGCFDFVISSCGKEKSMDSDPVFCRLSLSDYTITTLDACNDEKRCINKLIEIDSTRSVLTATSSNPTVTLVLDKILGEGDVKCSLQGSKGESTKDAVIFCENELCTVSCSIPDGITSGAGVESINVKLVYGLKDSNTVTVMKDLSNTVTATLVNCAKLSSCTECTAFSSTGCRWIYENSGCSDDSSKGLYDASQCPVITKIYPETVTQYDSTNITIYYANIPKLPDRNIRCNFSYRGSNYISDATHDVSSISCIFNGDDFNTDEDSVLLDVSLYFTTYNDNPIITAKEAVEAKACEGFKSCQDCYLHKDKCAWYADNSSGYRAGCLKNNRNDLTKVLNCPKEYEDSRSIYIDSDDAKTFSVVYSGNNLPKDGVYCFINNAKLGNAAVTVDTSGNHTYTCDISSSNFYGKQSATVRFALKVGTINTTDDSYVSFMETIDAYYLRCHKHNNDCSACTAEHDKCGVVYSESDTLICTYEKNEAVIGNNFWGKCLKKFTQALNVINLGDETVVFRDGGICPLQFNNQFQCNITDGGKTINYADFVCDQENAIGYCTFTASNLDENTPNSTNTSSLIIVKKGQTRDNSYSSPEGMTFSVETAYCRTDLFDCMACTNPSFQDSVKEKCGWNRKLGKCTVNHELDDDTFVSASEKCPTLSLPEDSVYIGDNTFQIFVTNAEEDWNLTLKLIAPDREYVCNTSYNNTKTFDVFCDELPEEEVSLKAELRYDNDYVVAYSSNTMTITKRPLSTLFIILIAAVAAILLALIIVLIAVIVHRKGGLRPFKFDVNNKPDFEPFRWATDLSAGKGHSKGNKQEWEQLRDLLQNPIVSAAVSKATAATEADKYTSAMVYINASNGHATDFVLKLVEDEVKSVPNETQLFRGNSLASKAFRAYSRMVGLEYLWMTLARFIHELNHLVESSKAQSGAKSKSVELESVSSTTTTTTTTTTTESMSILSAELEVDPTKLSAGADEESNSYMLSQRARQLLLCILNSTQYMPAELRYIAYNFAQDVHERFPGSERIAIGGTFFLRFICPALIAPHSYALLMTPDRKKPVVPNDQLQRQLVLLGKVLQNLANGVLFGKKEPFMIRMNQFITKNLESVGQWMDEISSSNASFHESPTNVPQDTLMDSYQFILAHITTNLRKIHTNLEQAQAPPQLYASLEAHTHADHQ